MQNLAVINDVDVAVSMLDPLRSRVLQALTTPGSASSLAAELGEARQKINYHLRSLEGHGLVELVEERPRRGLTERVMQATAQSFVISPSVLGSSAPRPVPNNPGGNDRLSASYLLAVASRLMEEVATMTQRADAAGQTLPTLTIDTEIRFRSAAERAEFTNELATIVAGLAARFHDETTEGGRWHRLMVAAHPSPSPNDSLTERNPHDR